MKDINRVNIQDVLNKKLLLISWKNLVLKNQKPKPVLIGLIDSLITKLSKVHSVVQVFSNTSMPQDENQLLSKHNISVIWLDTKHFSCITF